MAMKAPVCQIGQTILFLSGMSIKYNHEYGRTYLFKLPPEKEDKNQNGGTIGGISQKRINKITTILNSYLFNQNPSAATIFIDIIESYFGIKMGGVLSALPNSCGCIWGQ